MDNTNHFPDTRLYTYLYVATYKLIGLGASQLPYIVKMLYMHRSR